MVIEAKYEDGVFKPLRKVKMEEGTVVEIHVDAKPTARTVQSIGDLGFAGNVGRPYGYQRWRDLRKYGEEQSECLDLKRPPKE